jgi:hypothetical protein
MDCPYVTYVYCLVPRRLSCLCVPSSALYFNCILEVAGVSLEMKGVIAMERTA